MKEFTNELNKLLEKYPDLGEFSIHVQPRLVIRSAPEVKQAAPMPPVPMPMATNGVIREIGKDRLDGVLAMESKISKSKLAEMKASSVVE